MELFVSYFTSSCILFLKKLLCWLCIILIIIYFFLYFQTGLTQACLESNVTIGEAEKKLLDFVKKHVTKSCSPLAGSSVYMDRLFLRCFMPELNNYLHYRIIDVSSIKELCMRFNPEVHKMAPKKNCTHRALDDIKESIQELQYYKDKFFRCSWIIMKN